ncbi:MAG: hypothetical protein WCJ56_09090, partial [bacterium]
AGEHLLAIRVTHFGDFAGIGQMGGPAFLLVSAEGASAELNAVLTTGKGWLCMHDVSRTPISRPYWDNKAPFYSAGCGDRVDGREYPWDWEQPGYDDTTWESAKVVCPHAEDPWGNTPLQHLLRPDPLPAMERGMQRCTRVAAAPEGLLGPATSMIAGTGAVTILANSHVRLVLDRQELTNAYPVFTVSGGAGAHMRMVGAEAPYAEDGRTKGNRDVIEGKFLYGHHDEFTFAGGEKQRYSTLWFRAFRYLELIITTTEHPLRLDDLQLHTTGYPLLDSAKFTVDEEHQASYQKIWDVSYRTIRMCAHETFFDCPHYEQAQFPGDTRIQAIYHYLVGNDDLLVRKAIDDFYNSRITDGLTQCHYPSNKLQILPTFALYWMGMLHDFRVYRGDADFLCHYLPAARMVLDWFAQRVRPDGLLGHVDYAPFIDWNGKFDCGNAPQGREGGSAILTTLYAQACQWMAGLEQSCGFPELAPHWQKSASARLDAVTSNCWQPERGLLADTPEASSYSLHAQVEAVLAGVWPAEKAQQILQAALADKDIAQPGTLYYRYYLAQAMKVCGMPAEFFTMLPQWQRCLEGTGLTTWPESDGNPRSDCHAWSVTPAIEFLQTVLGVSPDPKSDGCARLIFNPTLGPLTEARGHILTPHGIVLVGLEREENGELKYTLVTPVPTWITAEGRWVQLGVHEGRSPA